jgi:hypothetical protein
MWNTAIGLARRLLRQTEWHEATACDRFIWRRWTPDGWEYREMTDEQQRRSFEQWSIK